MTNNLGSLQLVGAVLLSFLGACGSRELVTSPAATPPAATPPDSSRAAFLPLVGQLAFISTRDGSPYIYVAAADGSSLRRLTKGRDQDWSWDGQQIVFAAYPDTDKAGNPSVHVINADGTGEHALPVYGSTPHLSPDGRRISFTTARGLYVANIDGSNPTLLVPNDIQEPGAPGFMLFGAGWSPDGTRIALTSIGPWSDDGSTPASEVYVVKADGSGIETVVSGDSPRWSPDGSAIAFDFAGGIGGIAFANADGSGIRLGTQPIVFDLPFWPDWSPDGRVVSFTGGYAAGFGGNFSGARLGTRIFAIELSRNVTIQLVPDAANVKDYDDYAAVWSRAGKP